MGSMRRSLAPVIAAIALGSALLSAQLWGRPLLAQSKAKAGNVPEIPYHSVPDFLKLPPNLYLGEGIGVATNSKGHVFVYTRSGDTRLFEFDRNGAFVRELGQGLYGFEFAHAVRVDRDVAWDAEGNIFVADGHGANARVAKFDKNGRFILSWGSRGSEPGQFNTPHSIATDAQGNVYVADQGNKRIQVFDNAGTFRSQIADVGVPTALCISRGSHQYLYSAHAGDPYGMEDAAIYKLELDGRVVGKFGKAGKMMKELGLVNAMDCRNENELYVGELTNWRVQKLTLRPAAAR